MSYYTAGLYCCVRWSFLAAFAVFVLYLGCSKAARVSINPKMAIARLGDILTFNCLSQSQFAYVLINNELANFNTGDCSEELNCTFVISFVAQSNNTNVHCFDLENNVDDATVYIADKPQSPDPILSSRGPNAIRIRWDQPFALASPDMEPVLSYSLKIFNYSKHDWTKFSIPAHNSSDYTNGVLSLHSNSSISSKNRTEVTVDLSLLNVPQQCHQLVFYVSAVNYIGESEYRAVRGVFETVLTWPDFYLTYNLLYREDGKPSVLFTVQPPKVCSRQLEYSITMNCTSVYKSFPVKKATVQEFSFRVSFSDYICTDSCLASVSVIVTDANITGTIRSVIQLDCAELQPCNYWSIVPGGVFFVSSLLLLCILIGVLTCSKYQGNDIIVQAELDSEGHVYEQISKYQEKDPVSASKN